MLGGFVVAVEGIGISVVCVIIMALAIFGWLASRAIPPAEPANPDLRFDWNIIVQTY